MGNTGSISGNLRKTFATPSLKFTVASHALRNLFLQETVERSAYRREHGTLPATVPEWPGPHLVTRSGGVCGGTGKCRSQGDGRSGCSHDLIPLEFALLRAFLRQEEWTTTQLAQVLPVKPSRISRVVTKLADRGLISRRRPRKDRRVVILTLTEEGKAFTVELHRRVQAHDARLSVGVTEQEMVALASATSKIMANHASLSQSRSSQPLGVQ